MSTTLEEAAIGFQEPLSGDDIEYLLKDVIGKIAEHTLPEGSKAIEYEIRITREVSVNSKGLSTNTTGIYAYGTIRTNSQSISFAFQSDDDDPSKLRVMRFNAELGSTLNDHTKLEKEIWMYAREATNEFFYKRSSHILG